MSTGQALTTVAVGREQDVVLARQRARQVTRLLDFDGQDQVRVATAISELARNALEYGGGGKVEYFAVAGETAAELVIRISDEGGGIADLESVLSGQFSSPTGMGVGIVGARRLMDSFDIQTGAGAGTTVTVSKRLPGGRAVTESERAAIVATLASEAVAGPFGELQLQNQELIQALAELQHRRDELAELNRELEETNRGVVALYAELDERAEQLRRSSDTKTQFLSSVSHELRTPLTSMLALAELLLSRVDGPLTDEQERQLHFIHSAGESLLLMVNDLLELARVTSGKTAVRPGTIQVEELFGLLRGMFRPLHHNAAVALVFEPAEGLPSLYADEAKLAQILRNLISNALKFTRQGEVRIACSVDQERSTATFTVTDTGVGIAPDDVVSIFDEFVQIENAFQATAHGAGLGLAVCQRLTAVLGGRLDVRSEVGTGSEFTVELPLVYVAPDEADELVSRSPGTTDDIESGRSALIIDDDEVSRYLTGRTLRDRGYEVAEAPDGLSGLEAARERRPSLIVLDLKMPELDGFIVLHELKMDFRTAEIPVVIHTAKPVTAQERGLLGAAVAIVDKRDAGRGTLGAVIESLERGD